MVHNVPKSTELLLQLISTRCYNYQRNLPERCLLIGFGCHCLRTDGLIILPAICHFVCAATCISFCNTTEKKYFNLHPQINFVFIHQYACVFLFMQHVYIILLLTMSSAC